MPSLPSGSESVVMDMPAVIVRVNVLAVICSPTRSLTLNVKFPDSDGVPERVPVFRERVTPEGRSPLSMYQIHESGEVIPSADSV